MQILETLGAQGEIRIFRIDELPRGIEPLEKEKGRYIIGHSETGHHHVLEAEHPQVYQAKDAPDGMRVLYAILETPGSLEHLREHDTHAPHALGPGIYMFRTDREFDHYEKLARAVAD